MKHPDNHSPPIQRDSYERSCPTNLLRALAATGLFFTVALAHTAEVQKREGPLRVPKEILVDFIPGKTNYAIAFAVTNASSAPVPIGGYTASCQCTSVEATGDVVPPNGEIQIRATVTQREPTVQYVILQDSATNLYQTVIWIKPSLK